MNLCNERWMYILPKVAKAELNKYLKAVNEIPTAELWFNVRSTLFKSCKVRRHWVSESLIQGFKFMAYKSAVMPKIRNLIGSDGIQTHLPEEISRFGTTLVIWCFSLYYHTS